MKFLWDALAIALVFFLWSILINDPDEGVLEVIVIIVLSIMNGLNTGMGYLVNHTGNFFVHMIYGAENYHILRFIIYDISIKGCSGLLIVLMLEDIFMRNNWLTPVLDKRFSATESIIWISGVVIICSIIGFVSLLYLKTGKTINIRMNSKN